jgi:hypothetical protein
MCNPYRLIQALMPVASGGRKGISRASSGCSGCRNGGRKACVASAQRAPFLYKSTYASVERPITMPVTMDRLRAYHIQKTNTKAEAIARQRERKRVELEWRRAIQHVIQRYQIATPATIAACVGVNPVPTTANERTQLRALYRRLERAAAHGRFRTHYEYMVFEHGEDVPKQRQRKYAGHVWYVSLKLSRQEGIQYEHTAFIAHIHGTFERVEGWETLKTNTELREAKPPLVYDLYGKLNQMRLAVEANLSDGPTEVMKKCQKWQRLQERMQDSDQFFPADRYLWVVETEAKARNIRDEWVKKGFTSGQFWVTWKDQFSPYRPASVLEPIWLWAKDEELQAL